MTDETSLSLHNITYRYSKKTPEILHGISFAAKKGDMIAVLGPNGVGKSTMFKCLLGFFKSYGGSIMLGSKNINTLSRKEIAKRIAYIPQSAYPTFNYEVLDVVLMGVTSQLSLLAAPKQEHIEKAYDALKNLGIEHLAQAGYGKISGGERQLALIARALVQNAKILIMDEPTANLDYGNQFRVLCRVTELARNGYIILISTHNPDHAFLYANRVIMMYDGSVIADGSPNTVLDAALIKRVYNVDVNIETFLDELGTHKLCIPINGGYSK